jgi:hypothetical protein
MYHSHNPITLLGWGHVKSCVYAQHATYTDYLIDRIADTLQ